MVEFSSAYKFYGGPAGDDLHGVFEGADRHGSTSLAQEPLLNIRFDKHNRQLLTGCTLNNLLRALFLVHTSVDEEYSEKFLSNLGGKAAWSDAADTFLVTAMAFTTVDEIVTRVLKLIPTAVEVMSPKEVEKRVLLEGALAFLTKWSSSFSQYLSDSNLRALRIGCERVIFQCAACESNFANTAFVDLLQCGCDTLQASLERNTFFRAKIARAAAASSSIALSVLVGTNKELALQANKEEKLVPAENVDIFGGAAIFDAFGGDDEDDDDEEEEEEESGAYRPRLPKGFSAFQSPSGFTVWSFDSLELARQWTLLDFQQFLAVPPSSFVSSKPQWTLPRFRRAVPELRSAIDRFNATALWVTSSVLAESDSVERALLYKRFIQLAHSLRRLRNYSGMMAVVAGLQQGSVARLAETRRALPLRDVERLNSMHALMDGSKNYQRYRETVRRHLADEDGDDGEEEEEEEDGRLCGLVPYLPCHLSELAGISEGNPEYLPDAPYLLNLQKYRSLARCVSVLARARAAPYGLAPVRLIGVVINRTLREYLRFSAQERDQEYRELYARSEALEKCE